MKAFRLDVQLCMASQSMKSPPWSANRFMASRRKAGRDNPGAEARASSVCARVDCIESLSPVGR
jgi:hypothetical protein